MKKCMLELVKNFEKNSINPAYLKRGNRNVQRSQTKKTLGGFAFSE